MENYFDSFDNIYTALWKLEKSCIGFGLGDYLGTILSRTKGFIPEADYYDRYYKKNRWKSSTIYQCQFGQGELLSTLYNAIYMTMQIEGFI